MQYSKIQLAQTITTLCKMHDIKHVVISPGSRNAPLIIGFTNDIFFNCYSIVDERCAAFFALGMTQQLQKPVALVCTSGSALLNYYPAVAEAFYSNRPLVVLSADRPKHLVDIGDGQTIKQKDVYGDHVQYSANLKLDLRNDSNTSKKEELPIFKSFENKIERFLGLQTNIQTYNETEIHKALNESILKFGPVHINIPFDEPLYDTVEAKTNNFKAIEPQIRETILDKTELNTYLNIWQNAKRKLILVGVLQPNTIDQKWLNMLAEDESVLVLTETTSNLHHPDSFPEIDKLIAPLDTEGFKQIQPDVLLTFGGLVVSKKIKAFLRQYQPKHHWHVGKTTANDTFFCLKKYFKIPINTFFSIFFKSNFKPIQSRYKSSWLPIRNRRRSLHDDYLKTIPFSDFMVFDMLLKSIPKDSQLQVGNSSAIRYTQLFQLRQNITVFCNRGTSGIDGSTSTAIGASVVSKQRITLITGDLSFFYDSNALWNNYIPNSFRIILINNSGGGIFRILPNAKQTNNFETFFETRHNYTASHLCSMYHIDYLSAKNETELEAGITSFYTNSEKPKLLEIFTPSEINDQVLLNYFEYIK